MQLLHYFKFKTNSQTEEKENILDRPTPNKKQKKQTVKEVTKNVQS